VLDLADSSDLERARAWARKADVVVENFRPFVMERLGLGFVHNAERVTNRQKLRLALESALAHDRAETWAARLSAAGVPAGLVNDVQDAFALAERLGLDPVVEVADGTGLPVRLARNPVRLSKTRPLTACRPLLSARRPPRPERYSGFSPQWDGAALDHTPRLK
jgi:crotonobetainyl-CoA:carnitine CoA-transferase CaiB-like acyl-CoA transferase